MNFLPGLAEFDTNGSEEVDFRMHLWMAGLRRREARATLLNGSVLGMAGGMGWSLIFLLNFFWCDSF